MKKTIISLLVTVSIFLGIIPAAFADNSSVITVVSDREAALGGDIVTYTVSLSEPITTKAFEIHMLIDNDAAEGSITVNALDENISVSYNVQKNDVTAVAFDWNGEDITLSGDLFTVSFVVKQDVTEITAPSLPEDGIETGGNDVTVDVSPSDIYVFNEAEQDQIRAVQNLISAIGEVTKNSGAAIEAAEKAYAALTELQKGSVANYSVLTAARAAYNKLLEEKETEAPTAVPTNTPTAVPTEVPTAAPTEAPTMVPTEIPTAVPTDAPTEQPTEDANVTNVENSIARIGEITRDNYTTQEIITSFVRSMYDMLSDSQKANVENIAVLEAAEAAIAAFKASAENAAAVDEVIAAIGEVTKDSADKIAAARAAYDALDEDGKYFVTKYDVLTAAEEAYKNILEADAADRAAAQAVDVLIAAIGDVTADSLVSIETAENAYAALTETQKGYVTKYDTLAAARAAYNLIIIEQENESRQIAAVENAISEIGEVTRNNYTAKKAVVGVVRSLYNDILTDTQKAKVSNIGVLEAAEAAIAKYESAAAAAAAVDEIIAAIGEVTVSSADEIAAARAAYDALDEDGKYFAAKYNDLAAAENAYNALGDFTVDAAATATGYNISIAKKAECTASPVFIAAVRDKATGALISAVKVENEITAIEADTASAELDIYVWNSLEEMKPYESVTINK
ncbi:MAG: PT domain-containing protein [Candidatus Ornithomonoglobus sp.]